MKKKSKLPIGWLVLLVFVVFASACTKQINVTLNPGNVQLSVSAFINSKPTTQTVVLSNTAPYLNNTPNPAALGASVTLTDSKGNVFTFTDKNQSGYYTRVPAGPTDTVVRVNYSYTLTITYQGETYQGVSVANPVPKIDSITYQFKKGFDPTAPAAYYASFWATDIKNRTNYYWIQTFKNDSLLNPQSFDISIDGSLGTGAGNGLPFIEPVRNSITPFKGYASGDTCGVELNSINYNTYFFFQEVTTQVQNGGLFASPPFNVTTNMKNINQNSKTQPVGFFNIAMTSRAGIRFP